MSIDLQELPFYGLSNIAFLANFPTSDDDWKVRKERLFSTELSEIIKNVCNEHSQSIDYYSENRFNNNFGTMDSGNGNMFAVFHLNIRSLNCNYASLLLLLNDLHFKFDVIVLSEIWTVNLPFLANILNGFNFHYNLPKESTVGGIGIFIRDSINYNISHGLNIESTHTNLVENL